MTFLEIENELFSRLKIRYPLKPVGYPKKTPLKLLGENLLVFCSFETKHKQPKVLSMLMSGFLLCNTSKGVLCSHIFEGNLFIR